MGSKWLSFVSSFRKFGALRSILDARGVSKWFDKRPDGWTMFYTEDKSSATAFLPLTWEDKLGPTKCFGLSVLPRPPCRHASARSSHFFLLFLPRDVFWTLEARGRAVAADPVALVLHACFACPFIPAVELRDHRSSPGFSGWTYLRKSRRAYMSLGECTRKPVSVPYFPQKLRLKQKIPNIPCYGENFTQIK